MKQVILDVGIVQLQCNSYNTLIQHLLHQQIYYATASVADLHLILYITRRPSMTKAAELAKMGEVLTNSQIGGRRNIVINGAMQVAQRGTSLLD